MTYTVVWRSGTVDALADIWMAAADQGAVTDASYQIEQALRQHPLTFGVRRDASVNRTVVYPPLGVDFEVIEDDKKVRIVRVWAVA